MQGINWVQCRNARQGMVWSRIVCLCLSTCPHGHMEAQFLTNKPLAYELMLRLDVGAGNKDTQTHAHTHGMHACTHTYTPESRSKNNRRRNMDEASIQGATMRTKQLSNNILTALALKKTRNNQNHSKEWYAKTQARQPPVLYDLYMYMYMHMSVYVFGCRAADTSCMHT